MQVVTLWLFWSPIFIVLVDLIGSPGTRLGETKFWTLAPEVGT